MGSFTKDYGFGKQYERKAAEAVVALRWPGARVAEMPTFSDIDWLVLGKDDAVLGLVEVKARRIASTAYRDTLVAWRKHTAAKCLKEHLKVATLCVVVFTDTIAAFDLCETPAGKMTLDVRGTGRQIEHCLYLHSTFTFYPELLAQLTV